MIECLQDVRNIYMKIHVVIRSDNHLHALWKEYQKKYSYAADISYGDVMENINLLLKRMMVG